MHPKTSRYRDYLQSPEWDQRRRAALDHAEWRCQLCYADSDLQVHHRTYLRLYDELPTDLTVLCARCHAHHHGVLPSPSVSRQQHQRPSDRDVDSVELAGDTSAVDAKIHALCANSPEFRAVWEHETALDTTASYDLRLCCLAFRAMQSAELAELIQRHRVHHNLESAAPKWVKRAIWLAGEQQRKDEIHRGLARRAA